MLAEKQMGVDRPLLQLRWKSEENFSSQSTEGLQELSNHCNS